MQGIAAFRGSRVPRFVDVERPERAAPGMVLCRTLELGICGTDREILHSTQPLTPAGEEYLVLGHECLALVEECGADVTGVAAGDLVVPIVRRAKNPHPNPHPQAGEGTRGTASRSEPASIRVDMLSMGQYTERGIVAEHGFSTPWWLDKPEHLFPTTAALAPWAVLTEPFSVAEKGINEAVVLQQARLGEACWRATLPRVLVTGMGPIGFAALAACRCRDWPVTVYGRDPVDSFRAGVVDLFGATYLPAEQTDFEATRAEEDGFDLVLECTGNDEVIVRSAAALAPRGVTVWLGSARTPRPAPHNVDRLVREGVLRNHLFVGSVNAAPRDFRAALADLEHLRREMPTALTSLITHRVAPDDCLWHYENRVPQGIKTVVDFA